MTTTVTQEPLEFQSSDLSHVKQGDLLATRHNNGGFGYNPVPISMDIHEVVYVTPTQLAIGRPGASQGSLLKVRKSDGFVLGHPFTYAIPVTPEMVERDRQERDAYTRYMQLLPTISDLLDKPLHRHALTLEQVHSLAVAWEFIRDKKPPMEWPLPCNVKVGHGTMSKGVKLYTLVLRMKALYQMALGLDPDTMVPPHVDEHALDQMHTAMSTRLAAKRTQGRRGWETPECTREHLSDLLRRAVDKGDPVDVANYCAFLHARGETIARKGAVNEGDA